jgi:ubiquinone/menaquinone biosynthesis C-methylase UbiE
LPFSREGPIVADDGTEGWDEYAAFYDWENARTVGRRDVPFWQRVIAREKGPVLELGCGTGRLLMPVARACAARPVRAAAPVVGLDRSQPMLARAIARSRRLPAPVRPSLVRGDIRALPFPARAFGLVMAPYGMLQSLVRERDLAATLASVARTLVRGGLFGIDLVPDLPAWQEYRRRVSLRGRMGRASVTLIESVRQDRRRRLTIFDQRFVETRGGRRTAREFSLTFRTLPVPDVTARLERAGFRIEAVLGDYHGRPWDARASVWVILARKR